MSDSKIIIFLCKEEELTRERKGYFDAFKELGYNVKCSGDVNYSKGNPIFSGDIKLIIQPEASPILPFDVFELNIPVACFQIDTNLAARQRAK
ncbi:MAG: hypothetical protein H7329_02430, partial [Opitutaceae bacterium]|nr:hypothetical protein [Cytophagales bacterium]